jgi:hypothetical protein
MEMIRQQKNRWVVFFKAGLEFKETVWQLEALII